MPVPSCFHGEESYATFTKKMTVCFDAQAGAGRGIAQDHIKIMQRQGRKQVFLLTFVADEAYLFGQLSGRLQEPAGNQLGEHVEDADFEGKRPGHRTASYGIHQLFSNCSKCDGALPLNNCPKNAEMAIGFLKKSKEDAL